MKQEKNNQNRIFGILISVGLVVLAIGVLVFYFLKADEVAGDLFYKWVLLGIAATIIILAVIFAILSWQGKITQRPPDYRALFIIGITWIPLGLALKNPGFWVMGIVFMIIGLKNKNKWQEESSWKNMPDAQKRMKIALIIVLGIFVCLGLILLFLA